MYPNCCPPALLLVYSSYMPSFNLHYPYIFLAAAACMGVGFLWYSPALFGKPWSALMGFTDKALKAAQSKMGPLYGLSFVGSLLTAYVLALAVNFVGAASYTAGAGLGFWVWLGFIFPVQLTGEVFSTRPFSPKLLAINTGYQLTCLLVMGALLAVWV